jgi:hypothetical protein
VLCLQVHLNSEQTMTSVGCHVPAVPGMLMYSSAFQCHASETLAISAFSLGGLA